MAVLNTILSGVLLIQLILALQFLQYGYFSIPGKILDYCKPVEGIRVSVEVSRI